MSGCCGPFVPGGALQGENGADGGVAISASGSSVSSGTVVFANSNSVTFGMAGSTVTASFSTGNAIKSISGGTTNATGPGVSFANGSGVSWGVNGNTVTASVAAIKTITAGTTNVQGPGVSFANGSGVSFGANGSTITASVAPETPFAISAGTQSVSTGTVSFANSNGVTFGMSGSSQITASVSDITYNQWIPWAGQALVSSNALQSSVLVHPRTFPNLSWSLLNQQFAITGAALSTGTQSFSKHFGIYTKNVSTLSLLMSTSYSFSVDNSGTNNSSIYFGYRMTTVPWSTSLSKGDYWVADLCLTDGSSGTAGSFVRPMYLSGLQSAFSGFIGSSSGAPNNSIQVALGFGVYSVQTAALPNSIGFNELRGSVGESNVIAFALGSTI